MLIATCADEDVDDEPFTLEMAYELIGNTNQETRRQALKSFKGQSELIAG